MDKKDILKYIKEIKGLLKILSIDSQPFLNQLLELEQLVCFNLIPEREALEKISIIINKIYICK